MQSIKGVLITFCSDLASTQHVGQKFHKLLFFAFPFSSSNVPPGCQLPCLLETIESKQAVHHVAPSFLMFVVDVFFNPKQRKRGGTLHPSDFLPNPNPRDRQLYMQRSRKKNPQATLAPHLLPVSAALLSERPLICSRLRVPSPPTPPCWPRGGNKPPRWNSAVHVWMDYVTIPHSFLLIQSQTDVHVSAKQSITDPVPGLFRM